MGKVIAQQAEHRKFQHRHQTHNRNISSHRDHLYNGSFIYFHTPFQPLSIQIALNTQRAASQTQQLRAYCVKHTTNQQLTHVDERGRATMVDVSSKATTTREASACASVVVGAQIAQLIQHNNLAKGDVLTVAQIAGIVGAKKTAELIPLCHNIALTSVHVTAQLQLATHTVELRSTVRCCGQTGVEMEALTAVSVAALAVYDMCKAVSHDIVIKDVRLWSKSGGKRDFKRPQQRVDIDSLPK